MSIVPLRVRIRVHGLLADARGQTATEYLVGAGFLVATGLVLSGLVPQGLRVFVRGVVYAVRTIAP